MGVDEKTVSTEWECQWHLAAAPDIPGESAEAAWERQQESLMESGGRDDSAYRRDMIAAGRGHLLGGA